MSRPDQVWDRGLQPERTSLAWRRTGLLLIAASLAAVGLLGERLGWVAIVGAIPAALAGLGLLFYSGRYYLRQITRLMEHGRPTPSAALMFFVAIATSTLAATALLHAILIQK